MFTAVRIRPLSVAFGYHCRRLLPGLLSMAVTTTSVVELGPGGPEKRM